MIDVYSICLCHFYHGIYNGTGLCTVRSITEQPVFTAYREWADRILAEIIRKAASAIFQIGHKIGPAVLDIGDCLIHPGSPDRFLQVKPRQKALNDRGTSFSRRAFLRESKVVLLALIVSSRRKRRSTYRIPCTAGWL